MNSKINGMSTGLRHQKAAAWAMLAAVVLLVIVAVALNRVGIVSAGPALALVLGAGFLLLGAGFLYLRSSFGD